MKEIFIIRHAKSSWKNPGLSDIVRPLNGRGKRNAPDMAEFLKNREHTPEILISSPAVRAFKTAVYFSHAYFGDIQVEKETELYHGDTDDYLGVINSIDDNIKSVALFGHNPMITHFVNLFSSSFIPNIPTCGIAHLQLKVDRWNDIYYDENALKNLYFPKEVL